LVELLIASGLFLLAVAGFGYLLKAGTNSVESATRLNRAVYALQAKTEELRATPFEELLALNGSGFGDGSGTVSVAPVLADLVSIKLELEWDPQKTHLNLYALRSKY
jgi:hypothetical protein